MKTQSKLSIILSIIVGALIFVGCASTPGKFITSSSITVDKALKAYAVYRADGYGDTRLDAKVAILQTRYYMAEDAAIAANIAFNKTGDKVTLNNAVKLLNEHQRVLIDFITLITQQQKGAK